MIEFPEYKQYGGETKIALMDNSAISFFEQLEHSGYSSKPLLNIYDAILIPQWVMVEVKDSEYRCNYVRKLRSEGFPVFTIREEDYTSLADFEEINLYKIVQAVSSKLAALKSYLHRHVEKPDLLDLPDYKEWISKMYSEWPIQGETTGNGRTKKKNAGEISLTVLAEIMSWYYPQTEMVTVYTQDRDALEFQTSAHKSLEAVFNERTPVEISYKSNDVLLYQLYRDEKIDLENVKRLRKDKRVVIYTKERPDQAVALITKKLDNEHFAEVIRDKSVQIIF